MRRAVLVRHAHAMPSAVRCHTARAALSPFRKRRSRPCKRWPWPGRWRRRADRSRLMRCWSSLEGRARGRTRLVARTRADMCRSHSCGTWKQRRRCQVARARGLSPPAVRPGPRAAIWIGSGRDRRLRPRSLSPARRGRRRLLRVGPTRAPDVSRVKRCDAPCRGSLLTSHTAAASPGRWSRCSTRRSPFAAAQHRRRL